MPREGALAGGESDEAAGEAGGLLRLEGRLPDKVALGELHEPSEARLEGRRRVVDVVPVEAHPHLEAKRVAAAEAGGGDAAGGHEGFPHPLRVHGGEVQLEAVLAGVAGARDGAVDAGTGAGGEVVVADRVEGDIAKRLQDLLRLRSLHGKEGDVVGIVRDRALELARVLLDVGEVLVLVAAVDDHHQVVGIAIDEAVVFDGAALVADGGIVHLTDVELGDVIRRHVAHEVEGTLAPDAEFAHVADVEDAAGFTNRLVFGGNSGRVLHRHFVAGEGYELGAECGVNGVKRGSLERVGRGRCQRVVCHCVR